MLDVRIESLVGMTMSSVVRQDESIFFTSTSGRKFVLHHIQDCCEQVTIEDICGDLSDLVGSELVESEEVEGTCDDVSVSEYVQSYTWTFYKFRTAKGSVTIRFF